MSTTRINFEVPDEWNEEAIKHLPHGLRSEVYRGLFRMLLRDLKSKGMAQTIAPLVDDTATITTVQILAKVGPYQKVIQQCLPAEA